MLTISQPALSAHCKFAVEIKLFQHLKKSGEVGIGPDDLTEKTGVDSILLQRIMRHLIAMKMVSFSNNRFFGTNLSHELAANNYQKNV